MLLDVATHQSLQNLCSTFPLSCCMAIGGSEMIPVHCLGNGREEGGGDDGLGGGGGTVVQGYVEGGRGGQAVGGWEHVFIPAE